MLRARDVAARLAISLRQAYAVMRVCGYVQFGRSIRIEAEALDAYLREARRAPYESLAEARGLDRLAVERAFAAVSSWNKAKRGSQEGRIRLTQPRAKRAEPEPQ